MRYFNQYFPFKGSQKNNLDFLLVILQIFGVNKTQRISNMQRFIALTICNIPTHKFPSYFFVNPNYFLL